MRPDPIVEEVWRSKEALAMRFNGDVRALGRYLMEQQRREGRRVEPLPVRRIEAEQRRKAS